MSKKILFIFILSSFIVCNIFAFSEQWVMNIKAEVGGSYTIPVIDKSDLEKLGANKMTGMIGFGAGGVAEIGYIFGSHRRFKLPENHWFSGIGVFGLIGVSKGYAGQISGSAVNGKQIDVYVSIGYTPVITLGALGKAYFFNNRMAVGFGVGTKIITDTAPTYELYSTEPSVFPPEVGTIIVTEKMMKTMNPFMVHFKGSIEYNVPIISTVELLIGGYSSFNIYSPKYVSMPKVVMDAAITNNGFDPDQPVNSYYINSFDFGISMGLGIKL